jgi:N-carbamoylputrescine amidase
VDLKHQEEIRRNWPFLRDRRVDKYDGIMQRFLSEEEWRKK